MIVQWWCVNRWESDLMIRQVVLLGVELLLEQAAAAAAGGFSMYRWAALHIIPFLLVLWSCKSGCIRFESAGFACCAADLLYIWWAQCCIYIHVGMLV